MKDNMKDNRKFWKTVNPLFSEKSYSKESISLINKGIGIGIGIGIGMLCFMLTKIIEKKSICIKCIIQVLAHINRYV